MTTDNSTPRASYVFLSYASADRERALRIADLLEAAGVSIWVDRRSIAGGTSWSGEIVEAIKGCGALVVAISGAAMQSRNVQQEIQLAWEHERKILPLLLERAVRLLAVAEALRGDHEVPWEQVEFERLIVGLREQLPTPAFAAAWAEGQAMTLEEAVEYALEKTSVG